MNRSSMFTNRSIEFLVPSLLVLIIIVSEMSTAIYTPSLPLVASYFNISEALIQWTVSINLVGLALSGLLYGPYSDAFGRRSALRWGMGLFFVGSAACCVSNSIIILLVARFIQGFGGGVAVVVAFAVIRDLFDEKQSAVVLSYMGMAIALSPGLAPIAGSYITYSFGWKMCFGVVAIAALLIMLLLFTLMPETLQEKDRISLSVSSLIKGYGQALCNGRFILMSLIPALMIGGLWSWLTSAPILFINYLDVPLQKYGFYGFFGVSGYIIGTLINSRLVEKFSLQALLSIGLVGCLVSSVLLYIAGVININSPLIIQGLNYPFAVGLAFIIPNGTALAFSQVKGRMGTSSALLGTLEMGCGAICIFIGGVIFTGSIQSIALIMIVTSLLSLFLLHKSKQ